MDKEYCISVKGLTKKYSGFMLGELDFGIPKGFATALIGANGAGKTTLIDILCGVIPKTSGSVEYLESKGNIDDPKIRERIGYSASTAFFPLGYTAKDIAAAMEIAYKGFDRKKFSSLCDEMNVDNENTKKARPIFKQSDGNKMRTMLAAVFARKTDILIMDEPGSSLDPLMRDRLCDRMREYLDQGGGERSILFSTHNIADMENAADYAIFMNAGKIIEKGFVEDLKEKYVLVHGESENFDEINSLLLSGTRNRTAFEGFAYAKSSKDLRKLGAVCEIPTLQQLSIGLLRYSENASRPEEKR